MRKIRTLKRKTTGARFQPATTRGLRAVHVRAGSFDPTSRTFEFTLASETPCVSFRLDQRWNYVQVDEVLPMAALVGLDTFRGAPLLDTHSSWSVRDVLGRITALRIEGTELIASAFLSDRDDVAGVARDLETGVLAEFSVGFDIVEDGEPVDQESGIPLVRIAKWAVREGSLVPIPADPTAAMRGARSGARAPVQPPRQGSRAVDAEELKTKLTAIFETATTSIVEILTEDDGADDDATIEAEAEAAAEAARQEVLKKAGKAPAAPANDPARAAPKPAGTETAAARAAAVLRLRKAAERNGVLEDFNDFEATGASVADLQKVVMKGVQTSDAEIDTSIRSAGGAAKKPFRMADTPAGKKLAKVTK